MDQVFAQPVRDADLPVRLDRVIAVQAAHQRVAAGREPFQHPCRVHDDILRALNAVAWHHRFAATFRRPCPWHNQASPTTMEVMTTTTDATGTGSTRTGTLSRAEVERFLVEGYLGPYPARTPEQMVALRQHIAQEVLTTPGPQG